jgi:membrane protein DedA with SNARE-associated domain
MQIITEFTQFLASFAHTVPLPIFVLLASFIEEVIAPIPSPFVMTAAGSLIASQGRTLLYLGAMAVLGACSKTFGSWIIYVIADKFEDVIITKFGKFLGVSHEDTEGIGNMLNKGMRDDIAIFLLRAVPIIPTAPVSVLGGILKFNLKTYLTASFLGLVVRNLFYLSLGYVGIGALESINEDLGSFETIGYGIIFILLACLTVWFYKKRRAGDGAKLFDMFHKKDPI